MTETLTQRIEAEAALIKDWEKLAEAMSLPWCLPMLDTLRAKDHPNG